MKLEIYCGTQPPGPYEAPNSSVAIVDRLITTYKGSSRNLTADNWYTSLPLAQSLLASNITLVGTLKKNKKEIPVAFLPHKSREVGTTIFGFQKDATLVSYTTKRNKCVILLSTAHDDSKIDSSTLKPEIIMDYNKFKGGVDTVDQLGANYSVARKTGRWTMAIFFALLNVAGINARVLLKCTQPTALPKFRRTFLKNLAISLMQPHLGQRVNLANLPVHSKAIIRSLLPLKTTEEDENSPVQKKAKRTMYSLR